MRFADPRPDGRAIVYATIQADPLVARAAELLGDASYAQRLLARAAMNGASLEPDTWRAMFPTLFGPRATRRAHPRACAPRRSSRCPSTWPTAASRCAASSVARSSRPSRNGCSPLVPGPCAGSGGSCSTASPRRSIRTISRSSPRPGQKPGTANGARAASRPMSCTSSTTPAGTRTREGGRLLAGLIVFDARRSCEVRLVRERGPVAADRIRLVALESLDRLAGRPA